MTFSLVCLVFILFSAANAQYKMLPEETRIVKGRLGDSFNIKITLPGNYTEVQYGKEITKFENGECSTKLFNCTYVIDNPELTTVQMLGQMSNELKTATFASITGGPVPITVFFFNGYAWNSLNIIGPATVQPQYSGTLIYPALGRKTVSLTFSTFAPVFPSTIEMYYNNNKALFYKNPVLGSIIDKTKQFPQILNLEYRTIVFHKVITLTVRQNSSIEHYGYKVGSVWLTQTIDWTRAPSSPQILPSFEEFQKLLKI